MERFQEPSAFELYLPAGSGPHPLICMTPILGRLAFLEDLFFERKFAAYFAANGFATALIHRPIFEYDPAQGIDQIEKYLRMSVDRNRRVLDVLLKRPDIDPQRVGSFGISFGAIANSVWAASDPRLGVNVFALGGGNLADVFVSSQDPLMKSYRDAAFKATGHTKSELKAALEKEFCSDPLLVCSDLRPDRTLMILGIFDLVVPLRCGLALREKLGKPETVFLPLGHYFAVLAVPILKRIVVRFFKKKLV